MSTTLPPQPADDIASAQQQLANALGRARIGEDRELANKVRELGERVAHLLSGLLRTTRLHSADNAAFDKPVRDLGVSLQELHDLLGSIHLVAVSDQVYVNEIRIRTSEKTSSVGELSAELQRHNVGGLTFHVPPDGPGIRTLIRALGEPPGGAGTARSALAEAFAKGGLSGVELQGRFRFRMAGEAAPERAGSGAAATPSGARDAIGRALAAIDEEFQNLAAGRVPNALPLRRVVSELLERGLDAEDLWRDRPEAPALAVHQLRVAQLVLLTAQGLGLERGVQQDLGVAALYHDCGYVPAASGAIPFARHGAVGAHLVLRQKGFHEAKVRRVLALVQHHRDCGDKPRPGLFARMLRIAEDYETLLRRVERATPPLALMAMQKWAGTRYDPALLQLFVNALGAYPPGTLLRLEDGRVVRVAAPARAAAAFAAPRVRCLRLPDGSPAPPEPDVVDLRDAGRCEVLARL